MSTSIIGRKMIFRAINFVSCLFAAICFLYASPQANAMSVEPMLLDVTSLGKGSQQSFKVSNNSPNSLPVEITVTRVDFGPNGEQIARPAEDEFLIYPPLANIPKGSAQIFRVQWIGEPNIPASRSYRFAVSQVPVKRPKEESGIQISMTFGVLVNVAPPESTAEISIVNAQTENTPDGKRVAILKVKNTGNKHGYLRQSTITLSGGSWSAQITPEEFAQKLGFGIVQPGKERRFQLPIEIPQDISTIRASLEHKPR